MAIRATFSTGWWRAQAVRNCQLKRDPILRAPSWSNVKELEDEAYAVIDSVIYSHVSCDYQSPASGS